MPARTWRQVVVAAPGIGVAMLPKLACPLCWPAYAAVLTSLGLGFLISTAYLLPTTIAFLVLTLTALAVRANRRRGYGPLGLGLVGSMAVVIGKFSLESTPMFYTGIGILMTAAVWNAWPRQAVESCSCESSERKVN
jgi:mercuric ion transport protein